MRVPKGTPLVSIPGGGGSGNRRFNIGLGRPTMQANATAEMFGGGMDWTPIGKGVADVAKATSMIVQENLQKDAETRANNAYAALASEANDHLYGETGIFTRKGVNASTVVTDTKKFYEQAMQRHVKGMNPAAASLFNQMAERSRMSVQTAVARHESDEMRAAQFESIKAGIVANQQMAMNSYNNDKTFNPFREAIREGAVRITQFNGMGEPAATQFIKQALSETDMMRAERLIANGYIQQAERLAKSDTLLPVHQDKVHQAIRAEQARQDNLAAKGLREQEAYLKKVRSGIEKDLYAMAFDGNLSRNDVEEARDILPPDDYNKFLKMTRGEVSLPEKSDPETIIALRRAAVNGDADLQDRADDALRAGRITTPDHNQLLNEGQQWRSPVIKQCEQAIIKLVGYSETNPNPAAAASEVQALRDFREWLDSDAGKKASDSERLNMAYQIGENSRINDLDNSLLSVPAPLFLVGTRTNPDLEATKQATNEAYDTGKISEETYETQARRLKTIEKILLKSQQEVAATAGKRSNR